MNFDERRRKLSAFISLTAEMLKDEYNIHSDYPVVMYSMDEIFRFEYFMTEEGKDSKFIESSLCLLLALHISDSVKDRNHLYQRVSEIDVETKIRLMRCLGVKGQTREDFIEGIKSDEICSFVMDYRRTTEHPLATRNLDRFRLYRSK